MGGCALTKLLHVKGTLNGWVCINETTPCEGIIKWVGVHMLNYSM